MNTCLNVIPCDHFKKIMDHSILIVKSEKAEKEHATHQRAKERKKERKEKDRKSSNDPYHLL